MLARARVVAEGDGRGGTRLATVRSEAPLILRETADALYLVGGAGGPLGGDDLALDIDVGPGARLTIRTAAASVAQPGPGPSIVSVTARIATGGELRWLPEPVVAARGCDHHMSAVITLDDDSSLVWREEVVLGRHLEPSGSVVVRSRVDVGGAPLLRHELALGPLHPAAAGPAVTAGARTVGSVLLVGRQWGMPGGTGVLGETSVILPLAGTGLQVLTLAADASALGRQLDAGVMLAGSHTPTPAAP